MLKLKVIYDDIIFRLQNKGGISYVFSELINGNIIDNRIDKELLITSEKKNLSIYFSRFSLARLQHIVSIPNYLVQFSPLFLFRKNFCIFHQSYYNYVICSKNVIKVLTVHDFGYEKKLMRTGIRRKLHIYFKRLAIINANAIVCVSSNTKDDLHLFYGKYLKDKSVKVIYNGIDNKFFEELPSTRIVDGKYILYVGNRAGYKQFDIAIKLVELIEDRILVIVGGNKLSNIEIDKLKRISGRYLIDVNVDVKKLINYYTFAECLVYPSLYEGFGLPVIEANACGCPVIAGRHSSIAEISNGLNYLVDNNNVLAFHEEYLKIRNDFNDVIKNNLIANAKKFKSQFMQQNTYDFYYILNKKQ